MTPDDLLIHQHMQLAEAIRIIQSVMDRIPPPDTGATWRDTMIAGQLIDQLQRAGVLEAAE